MTHTLIHNLKMKEENLELQATKVFNTLASELL
jgi:hypothetical protein